jgi:hypothetical protein
MRYPKQANELIHLLKKDQEEIRALGRLYFHKGKAAYAIEQAHLKQRVHERAVHMLAILDEIGEPSLANIGAKAAQAVSILATHEGGEILQKVLGRFNAIYARNIEDVYYQAIPAMTDWLLLQRRKKQRFGTQWLFDENKQPFLPTVEDFAHVNERRAEYGIEPLRWPKSLAIPESDQPWLQQPLSELVMREPTEVEYAALIN